MANDNMCDIDGLKISKCELPFPNPLSKMWFNMCDTCKMFSKNANFLELEAKLNCNGKLKIFSQLDLATSPLVTFVIIIFVLCHFLLSFHFCITTLYFYVSCNFVLVISISSRL